MSEEKKEELAAAAARATERFDALELEQKVQRLKELGILDDRGDLSARYGGQRRARKQAAASGR